MNKEQNVEPISENGNSTKPLVVGSLPLDDESILEPIQNALYAAGFSTDSCTTLANGILLYLKDYGYAVVRQ